VGSHVSGSAAEIFLQNHGKLCMKYTLQNNKILYNNRYVDAILMLINHNKVAEDRILNTMNNALEIKMNSGKHWVPSYVYWTVHHLDSGVKRDQLDVTYFIISLFNAQHVSDVNTSILRSLRLIC